MEPVISFGSYECGCETVPAFEIRSWLPKSDCSLLTFYEGKSISEHYQIWKLAFSLPFLHALLLFVPCWLCQDIEPQCCLFWTLMCMFTGRKVDGCHQSLIVISGTSSCSHSNASMYFTFLSTQLCREVLAWRIEVEGRVAESYTFLFSVSSSHQLFLGYFNLILKRHQAVINRMSGYIIPLMERNPLWTNAPKNRVENDKEHVYIKLVMDSLFVW